MWNFEGKIVSIDTTPEKLYYRCDFEKGLSFILNIQDSFINCEFMGNF